jgi:predicted helicase
MREVYLRNYLKKLEMFYKTGRATEHTYRPVLQELFNALLASESMQAFHEPKRAKCGAPDYAVVRGTGQGFLTVGYVETKDIGVPLDRTEQSDQIKRYLRAIDNLVLTDYLEFRWYVQGERRMAARLAMPRGSQSLSLDILGIQRTSDLLCSFLEHRAETIRNPKDLAARMAKLAHIIRDITLTAFEKEEASAILRELYEAFKTVLIPDLSEAQFSDMFAQTLAYGLFAARYNHKSKKHFTREDAAKEIPRTNPFLRHLFAMINTRLDDEPFVGFVDELVQILATTDMDAVLADFGKRTRQEDPIIHFYETFLSQYDPKLRELRGVYYTPNPVVSYIIRSVDYLLRERFGCSDGLADISPIQHSYRDDSGQIQEACGPRVLILDPACGTGTFLYAVVDHIREAFRQTGNAGMWSGYVHEHLLPRLFGFELLMASYAVAHLKLGMQLAALDLPVEVRDAWSYKFEADERLGLYLTNTLEQGLVRSKLLLGSFISDEANAASKVKHEYPVMVIVGNPPYSGHSVNNGPWIYHLLRGKDNESGKKVGSYFEVDGKPLAEHNTKWLNDDYVKFIRFSQWRIEETGYGILAFITNHGYLDNPTFRGMRQCLMQSFDEIFVLDLHGSSKKKEQPPDGMKDENIFDIQQGVAIGIFVKWQGKVNVSQHANVYYAELWGARLNGGKYDWLDQNDVKTTAWTRIEPASPLYLFRPQNSALQAEYEGGWSITQILPEASLGCLTKRDNLVIGRTKNEVRSNILRFISDTRSDKEAVSEFGLELADRDMWNAPVARKSVKPENIDSFIRKESFRPFDTRYIFYHEKFVARLNRRIMHHLDYRNLALVTVRQLASLPFDHIWVTNTLSDQHLISVRTKEGGVVFPLYIYPRPTQNPGLFDEQLSDRRASNLSPSFIAEISRRLAMQFVPERNGDLYQTFGPEDIFHYMYAVFYSLTYRARYADFLKVDFPRLPLTSKADLFRELCLLGARLVRLHLMEIHGDVTSKYPVTGNNLVEKVEYMEPNDQLKQGRVYINRTQYFEGVSPEVWRFHVGAYQVCRKWLKDWKGRTLVFEDIQRYQIIVAVLKETIQLMEQIDMVIRNHGGWPI